MTDDDPGVIHPEPLTGYEIALMYGQVERLTRALITHNGLNPNGLQAIRVELSDGSWGGMAPVLEGKRQVLLADVCRELSDATGIPIDYFVQRGHVPASAPDTIAELDTIDTDTHDDDDTPPPTVGHLTVLLDDQGRVLPQTAQVQYHEDKDEDEAPPDPDAA